MRKNLIAVDLSHGLPFTIPELISLKKMCATYYHVWSSSVITLSNQLNTIDVSKNCVSSNLPWI